MKKRQRHDSSAAAWDVADQQSRNLAKREMKDAHEILRPIIRFGQKLLRTGVRDAEAELDRVLSFSYRQTLEFVDGVDMLLRHHMVTPAGAQARSALESAVQTCYLSFRGTPRLAAAYTLAQLRSRRLLLEGRRRAPNVTDEEREALDQQARGMWDQLRALVPLHPPYAAALQEIDQLGDGEPWYRVFKGPRSIHKMMELLDLSSLSIYYRELNSIVHLGLPTAGLASDAGEGDAREWLRPLRSVTDWWPMPLKVAIVSADLATQAYIVQYHRRHPDWLDEMLAFQKEHGVRCSRVGMPDLAMNAELRTHIEQSRAAGRESV